MSRKIAAELAAVPVLLVPSAAVAAKPQYQNGVYLSGIGRIVVRRIATDAKTVVRGTDELLAAVEERGQVGAIAKLSGLRDECLIAEDSASRKTRPMWRASLAMIRQAIAALHEQPATVREVA